METTTIRKNANDSYQQFNGTDHYYSHWLGFKMTDGVMQLANDYQCHWFIDIIASYQGYKKFKANRFQVWKLKRIQDARFWVIAEDGDNNKIGEQLVPFSDFKDDDLTMWLVDGVILLPSEY